ncbi:MAG: hypothetical protein RMJ00_03640 [Nitrososphaerota archaeon]|nr:hypothetical protein [Candidatus Bathyarchaeota archaeon]MDW8061771.1 hypothetical protein [Nitrososphaerota archaeon]
MREDIGRVKEELERVSEERRNLEKIFYELKERMNSINYRFRLLNEEIDNLRKDYRKIKDDMKEAIEKLNNIKNSIKEKKLAKRKIYEEINMIRERASKPYSYVKNRLRELDHMIQIHPTDPNWEKNIIKEMKQLSLDMKIYKEIGKKREFLMSIKLEEEYLKFEAANLRNYINDLKIKINNIRLNIIDKKDMLYKLIKEKEEVKTKLNGIANNLNELRIREKQLIESIKTEYEKVKNEKVERGKQMLKAIAEEAERKLKRGGRLTRIEIEALSMFRGDEEGER